MTRQITIGYPVSVLLPDLSTENTQELLPFLALIPSCTGESGAFKKADSDRAYQLLKNGSLSEEGFKAALSIIGPLVSKDRFLSYALSDRDGEELALRLMTDDLIAADGIQILNAACKMGFKKVVERVLLNGKPKGSEGFSPFFSVVRAENLDDKQIEILDLLLKAGFNINEKDHEKYTPLMDLLKREDHNNPSKKDQNLKFTKEFMEKGAAVNDANIDGETPLHFASEVEFVQLLHSKGGNINAITEFGTSVIETKKNLEAVRFLARAGADLKVKIVNRDNKTLLHVKLLYGSIAEVAAFLDCTDAEAGRAQEEFKSRFSLGHCNSIKTKESEEISYRASFNHDSCAQIVKILETLPDPLSTHITTDEKQKLLNAFKLVATQEIDQKEVFSSIQQEKLTILPVGFSGHAIYLVFCNGYMAILNRGAGAPSSSILPSFIQTLFVGTPADDTVKAFKINSKAMTPEIVSKLIALAEGGAKEALQYYYETLPSLLSPHPDQRPVQDKVCKQLENLRAKLQKIGNCTFTQAKLSARLGTAMLRIKKGSLPQEAVTRAYQFSKDFSTHLRLSLMDRYLSFDWKGLDRDLLTKTYGKLKKRVKAFPDLSIYPHFKKGMKTLEELYNKVDPVNSLPYSDLLISYH